MLTSLYSAAVSLTYSATSFMTSSSLATKGKTGAEAGAGVLG